MNKKLLIVVGGLLLASATTFAQKAKIKEANRAYEKAAEEMVKASAMSAGDPKGFNSDAVTEPLLKAKAAADEAVVNAETANNADAWFAKGVTYIELSRVPKFADKKYYNEGIEALKKAFSINPKVVNKEGAENSIFNAGIFAFNGALGELNEGNYDALFKALNTARDAFAFNDKKLFKDRKDRDTLLADIDYYEGFGYYSKKDYPKAITVLEEALKNPITQGKLDPYRILAFSYGEVKNADKQIATMEAAKKKFPNNKDLEADELNYFITQGKETDLINKFEGAVAKEPNNSLYVNNLAVLYRNMGMEKNGKFADNASEWHKKAEDQMKKAIELEPNNAIYNYNLSTIYVIKGDYVANKMNSLGTSKTDNQKYDEMVKIRKGYLDQAIAALSKMESILEPKLKNKTINPEEKGYLFEGIQTMARIYAQMNNADKAKEYNEKLREYEDKF